MAMTTAAENKKKNTATATAAASSTSIRSRHIPEDLIDDIQTRLAVSCLPRLRLVSKSWNSLISSPNYLYQRLFSDENEDPNTRILISTVVNHRDVYTCVSYDSLLPLLDNDAVFLEFPSELPPGDLHYTQLGLGSGGGGGSICLKYQTRTNRGIYPTVGLFDPATRETKMFPSLPGLLNHDDYYLDRNSIGVALIDGHDRYYRYKVVCARHYRCSRRGFLNLCLNQVYVFSSEQESLGWRELLSPDDSSSSILPPQLQLRDEIPQYGCSTAAIRKCYWIAKEFSSVYNRVSPDPDFERRMNRGDYKLVSFDPSTEMFMQVGGTLPFTYRGDGYLPYVCMVKEETLVVFNVAKEVVVLQQSEKSWCKLFTLQFSSRIGIDWSWRLRILGLAKHGKVIFTDGVENLQVIDVTTGETSALPFEVLDRNRLANIITYVPSKMSLSSSWPSH
ncbi:hypothetical protein LINGRAHAP2_LOCUS8759 [Linum grandiflorum]